MDWSASFLPKEFLDSETDDEYKFEDIYDYISEDGIISVEIFCNNKPVAIKFLKVFDGSFDFYYDEHLDERQPCEVCNDLTAYFVEETHLPVCSLDCLKKVEINPSLTISHTRRDPKNRK